MKDIPYNVLKQNEQTYQIMLFHDQQNRIFSDIAREYRISQTGALQAYTRIKIKQIRLYINHIAFVLGHDNISQVHEVFDKALDCYQDWTYACAYLEQKYEAILKEYRDGEPGMPEDFIRNMPPFRAKLNDTTIHRIVDMREKQKLSFIVIGKKLKITKMKAKHTYDMFYHKQVLAMVRALQEQTDDEKEKMEIWEKYFRGNLSPKKCYDMLKSEIIES